MKDIYFDYSVVLFVFQLLSDRNETKSPGNSSNVPENFINLNYNSRQKYVLSWNILFYGIGLL